MQEARFQRLAAPMGNGAPWDRVRDDDRDGWSGGASLRDGGAPRSQGRGALRGPEALDQRLERWVNRGRDLVDGVSGARPGGRFSGGRARDSEVAAVAGGPGSRAGDGAWAGGQPRQGRSEGVGGGFNPGRLGRWVEDRLDWLLDEDGEDDWREPWQEGPSRPGATGPSTWSSASGAVAADDGSGGWRQSRPQRYGAPPPPSAAAPPSEAGGAASSRAAGASSAPRRGLEAISRRGTTGGGGNPPVNGSAGAMPPPGQPPDGPWRRQGAVPASGVAAASDRRAPDARAPRPDQDDWPDEASFSVPRWRRPAAERPADPLARPAASAGAIEEGGGRPLPRSSRRR
jgi:hypothetical protein